METLKKPAEYVKPEVKDYGDLRELTAASSQPVYNDVPIGQPINGVPSLPAP